ncbi:TonB-dependent receptor, partial [Parabacteroides sp. OttesenSCG-928-O15]|nr:TonB-dependent receptor [Parabacteroides sp. OttesenSCG-928-O15]
DKEITDIIYEILPNCTYRIENKNIILIPLSNLPARAQQGRAISGVITDELGEPLIGASVQVKGKSIGTVTDYEGKFTLNVENKDILEVSYIGYITQSVAVGNKTSFNIVLLEDVIGMEEVVVIGYGTIKTADVTSSVVSVKPDNFTQGSVRDVGQLIQGKVAGLIINTTSGNPSGSSSIRLRGNTTLNGTSTNPLILIDGVPGDFNTVSPEDIESVDVLKDGSAAAIYGTRGTNGVIIITTKRASADIRSRVDYSGYISTQGIRKKTEVLDADDYHRLISEGVLGASHDYGGNTNWFDEISRTPLIHNHDLTIRGGSQQTNYLVSLNYNNSEGIFKKSFRERFSLRGDMNHKMFDGKLLLNVGIVSRNDNSSSFSSGVYRMVNQYHPTIPLKDEDGNWYEAGIFEVENPVSRIMEQDNDSHSQFTRINGTVTFKPIEGLNLQALVSYSKYNSQGGSYETSNHISTIRNGRNGVANLSANQSMDRLVNLTAEYKKNFKDHIFTLLVGYSYEDTDYRSQSMNNSDFATDIFGQYNIGLAQAAKKGTTFYGMSSGRSLTNLIGLFGRVNYNYKNRYLLMASLRREGASQLYGAQKPWGTFPAISVGWRLKEESFLRDVSFINDLKLRAGYGVTGTQPSSSFLGVATLRYSGAVFTDGQWIQTLVPGRNPNPHLRWEEKHETNVGVDFAFLRGRLSGSVDYYVRVIDGLLYDYTVPVPPNLVNTTRANVGEMKNEGVEVLIRTIPVKTKDLEWSSDLNFSTNNNKLVTLSNDLYEPQNSYITAGDAQIPIYGPTHRLDIGGEIGNFWGYKVIDIDNDGKWIYESPETGEAVAYDDFAKVDENKMILGNGLPKFYLSWNNSLRYKNFDFAVTMRGAFGYEILNFERMYYENPKTHSQYNRLKTAYDPIFGKAVLNSDLDLEYNSYYIEKGDHWKIDNITLGYTFDTKKWKYIDRLRVYASSLNTFVFTNYKGTDPEVSASGLAPGNDSRDKYPTVRTFTFGLNVTF